MTYGLTAVVLLAAAGCPKPPDLYVRNDIATATCGPGSAPEPGIQGRVPRADRDSGRSRQPYTCNLALDGSYQGTGGGILSAQYGDCVYMGSFGSAMGTPAEGVQVVDVSDPTHPTATATLKGSSAVAGTWETLKVHEGRGLLVAAGTTALVGAGLFDVYDVKTDCRHPRLLNGVDGSATISMPIDVLSHEGGFSPDGMTYYSTSTALGVITAVGLEDPAKPQLRFSGSTIFTNHGFSMSADGNTMYGVSVIPSGIQILDVSDIQQRRPNPRIREISSVTWEDGLFTQHTIPITQRGRPYLIAVDEAGGGHVRVYDIADPRKPVLVRKLVLAINDYENRELRADDVGGNGLFGYEAHYCTVDRNNEPTALACGFYQSGIRVFDIRNLFEPREIAYYNPGGLGGGMERMATLPNSPHVLALAGPAVFEPIGTNFMTWMRWLTPDLSTDWCASAPRFVGSDRLVVTCSDHGTLSLRFTNGVYRRPAS